MTSTGTPVLELKIGMVTSAGIVTSRPVLAKSGKSVSVEYLNIRTGEVFTDRHAAGTQVFVHTV
jgi:hypothetical protein